MGWTWLKWDWNLSEWLVIFISRWVGSCAFLHADFIAKRPGSIRHLPSGGALWCGTPKRGGPWWTRRKLVHWFIIYPHPMPVRYTKKDTHWWSSLSQQMQIQRLGLLPPTDRRKAGFPNERCDLPGLKCLKAAGRDRAALLEAATYRRLFFLCRAQKASKTWGIWLAHLSDQEHLGPVTKNWMWATKNGC